MIRVDRYEQFPILVQLVDEQAGTLATGQTVYYDIRNATDDSSLFPPVAGTLTESLVEPGLYRTVIDGIPAGGQYLIYATCSGFITNSEELIVNPENIYELTKQNRHYNISVEDVIRENTTPTASQTTRKVPLGRTDYVLTWIKYDDEEDWCDTTTSGITYAWYRDVTDTVPYKMGGPGECPVQTPNTLDIDGSGDQLLIGPGSPLLAGGDE